MATATQTQTPADTGAQRRTSANRSKFDWAQLRTYLGVAIIVIWGLGPALWMVITSFRDVGYTFETTLWPTHPTLDNYRTAFSTELGNHFGRALLNSVIIGVVVTVLAMAAGVFCAYALARLEFKGKYALTGAILAASMFPPVALVSPLFQLFTNIHWIGKYQALIVPDISFALPLTIYILVAFFREMPWDLEESARIDGCTQAQAFRKIILPLAAPGLFTTAILAFIAAWNEFLLASQLASDKTQPVTVAIANFAGAQPHQEPYTAVMAAGTIITIPLVIMVLLLQKKIVAGLTAGGVKG
jgi:multiple sugar transport system permease protein